MSGVIRSCAQSGRSPLCELSHTSDARFSVNGSVSNLCSEENDYGQQRIDYDRAERYMAVRLAPQWRGRHLENAMRLSAVRNRKLSLWQSAGGEVTTKFAQSNPKLMSAMELAASLHAAAADKGIDIPPPPQDQPAIAKELAASNPQTLAYVSKLVFDVARAHQSGNINAETAAMGQLKDFVTRHYASLDILGWMQCVWQYLEYYVAAHRKPPYVDWAEQSPPNINFGIVDFRLPSSAKILLLGDWGTRM